MRLAVATFPGATKALLFDGLSQDLLSHVHFMYMDSSVAASADVLPDDITALIVVREVNHPVARKILAVAAERGIPWYFLLDDNFWLLSSTYPSLRWFESPEARELLGLAAGFIVSSRALADYVATRGFHSNIQLCGPVTIPALETPPLGGAGEDGLVVAFQGGSFRNEEFNRSVAPALAEVSNRTKVTLLVRSHEAIDPIQGVEIVVAGFDVNFHRFIRMWRVLGPHVVIHPHWTIDDAPFKTANAILVARLLGALPVVGDELPYATFGEQDGVIKVSRDPASWTTALNRLCDHAERNRLFARLASSCERAFSGETNEKLLRSILSLPQVRNVAHGVGAIAPALPTPSDTANTREQSEIDTLRRRLGDYRFVLETESSRLDEQEQFIKTQQAELDRRYHIIKAQQAELDSYHSAIKPSVVQPLRPLFSRILKRSLVRRD